MRIAKKAGLFAGLIFAGLSSLGFAKGEVSTPDDQAVASQSTKSTPVTMTKAEMDQVVAGGGSCDDHGHEVSGHDSENDHGHKPVIRGEHGDR